MEENQEDVYIMEKPHIYVERTLCVIKPDAIQKTEEILEIITKYGFTILAKRRVHLSPEQVSDLYAELYGKMFFPSLVQYVSSGPVVAVVIAKDKAISLWNRLIGPPNTFKAREECPDSLRAIYGTDNQRNALHGSDSYSSAEREIRFFFPDMILEPVCAAQAAKDYLVKNVNPTLLKGLTALCKQKPENCEVWLADWLIENNPNKPKIEEPN